MSPSRSRPIIRAAIWKAPHRWRRGTDGDARLGGTLFLIDLAGAVALLLWGVHMVQSGVQRALGPSLRRILAGALDHRLKAFGAGLGITAILQSSTATGLIVASFAADGLVGLTPALAVMLGANVGTTLIVQVLSFDVSSVAGALVLLGVVMFRRGTASRTRDLGRVAIGLGLMLLALHLLVGLITPYEQNAELHLLLGSLSASPLLDVLLAAIVTWGAHSSVAVVLLVMSFATKGLVPPDAAFALVLGANLGSAVNPVIEVASGDDPAARRVPVGNLLNRVIGCAVALLLLAPAGRLLAMVEPDAARAVADFHTAFNLILAVILLPLLGPYGRLVQRLLPARPAVADPSRPMYLDPSARESPPIALAAAAREALRMADTLEAMLAGAQDALTLGDRRRIDETRRLDDVLDRLNSAIKSYVSTLDEDAMTPDDHRRLEQVLRFATNLEQAGDVIDGNLMGVATKRLKRGLAFSAEGTAEIATMLRRLSSNLRAAAAVFMSEDARAARQLAAEKEVFRDMESQATAAHFTRLRSGRVETAETSSLHLDVLRDLKQLNAHLVAAAAYPVLEGQGELLSSRLKVEG